MLTKKCASFLGHPVKLMIHIAQTSGKNRDAFVPGSRGRW